MLTATLKLPYISFIGVCFTEGYGFDHMLRRRAQVICNEKKWLHYGATLSFGQGIEIGQFWSRRGYNLLENCLVNK